MASAIESGDGSVRRPAPDSGTTSSTPPPSQHATTGTPAHQRLGGSEAEALALRRKDHDVRLGEEPGHFGRRHRPREVHERADAEPLDLALQRGALRSVADDGERKVVAAGGEDRERPRWRAIPASAG